MKTIVKILILCFAANLASAEEASIKGEWKGAYIINAHVTTINFYVNSNDTEQQILLDVPSKKIYGLEYNLVFKNNELYFKRKNKSDVLIEFKGTLNNNIVTGSYHYNSEYMKDKPGIFQLMRSSAPIIKGDDLPKFNLALVDGSTISNKSFKNKYVMLDFWATWCPPCVAKRPKLEKLYEKYGDQIEIVSISLDATFEIVDTFRKEKYPMKWLHSFKPDKMKDPFVKSFVPGGLPYGYLINPDGKVVAFGNDLNAGELEETFERLLN